MDIADVAIAIWTLQHCFKPDVDIDNIHRMLTPFGTLFVVNNVKRVVPVENGRWADDQIDIDTMICERGFEQIERGQFVGEDIAPAHIARQYFLGGLSEALMGVFTVGRQVALEIDMPGWWLANASVDMDFRRGLYYD